MSDFRTIVSPASSPHKMAISDRILTIGSCFADVIGEKLQAFKVVTSNNPFGILYNPLSIHKALGYAIANRLPPDNTYLLQHELSLNYDFHSEICAESEKELRKLLGMRISDAHAFLSGSTYLMMTYGTAWVYARRITGDVVANCHKHPQSNFEKRLLTVEEVTDSFERMFDSLKAFNPTVRIILTISPVRHLKDSIELNTVSKSVLRLACYEISRRHADAVYFPSFEIVMDDLRDYRFYKADLIHPNEVAEQYIWEMFIATYFDVSSMSFIRKWEDIRKAMDHKPFHPGSAAHRQFIKGTLAKLETLALQVNVDKEIEFLKMQLQLTLANNKS